MNPFGQDFSDLATPHGRPFFCLLLHTIVGTLEARFGWGFVVCRWIKLIVPFCLCSLLYLGGCAAVPSPADRDEAEADEPLLPALKAQKATSENSDLTETEEAVFAAAADPNEEDGED